MPATARQIPVTGEELASQGSGGGGAYAELDVPCDVEMTLVDVNDYDKRSKGKSYGWIFEYQVETPSGNTVSFNEFLAFSPSARWKLIQVLTAHGVDLSEGLNTVDPNALLGDVVGGHIDFPRDRETDEPTSAYREIREVFPLADLEAVVGEEEEVTPEIEEDLEEIPEII